MLIDLCIYLVLIGVTGYPTILAYGRGRKKEAVSLETESNHPAWAALEMATTILKLAHVSDTPHNQEDD